MDLQIPNKSNRLIRTQQEEITGLKTRNDELVAWIEELLRDNWKYKSEDLHREEGEALTEKNRAMK